MARGVASRGAVVRDSALFWLRHRGTGGPRIFYLLTPPPRLRNVGDQAQVVAIRAWVDEHYPGRQVVEIDKDQQRRVLPALRRVARADDLVLLHSGGNLGDRGIWSETARRAAITALRHCPVVSLPQTIFFSDTPTGRHERATTEGVYAGHRRLVVIGRDPVSAEQAAAMFPGATTFALPDPVLSLPPRPRDGTGRTGPGPASSGPLSVLLCLRQDDESATGPADVAVLRAMPHVITAYDTTLDHDIAPEQRHAVLAAALDLFSAADVVVTDRFHGVIFSVLCRRPVVVLRTVDHKLTSAISWFEGMSWVRFAGSVAEVPGLVDQLRGADTARAPDFRALYFDPLPGRLAEALRVG